MAWSVLFLSLGQYLLGSLGNLGNPSPAWDLGCFFLHGKRLITLFAILGGETGWLWLRRWDTRKRACYSLPCLWTGWMDGDGWIPRCSRRRETTFLFTLFVFSFSWLSALACRCIIPPAAWLLLLLPAACSHESEEVGFVSLEEKFTVFGSDFEIRQ